MKTQRYYEITATIQGGSEILFGSFDKSDCTYELDASKDGWKEEGYKGIKIVSREVTESPDPEIYGPPIPEAEIQSVFSGLVEGNEMTCDGEPIDSTIDSIESEDVGATVRVNFEDEYMSEMIAGNVSCRIYDEMERRLRALGYEITDTDGPIMHLERI